jgi:hypothetical protein
MLVWVISGATFVIVLGSGDTPRLWQPLSTIAAKITAKPSIDGNSDFWVFDIIMIRSLTQQTVKPLTWTKKSLV